MYAGFETMNCSRRHATCMRADAVSISSIFIMQCLEIPASLSYQVRISHARRSLKDFGGSVYFTSLKSKDEFKYTLNTIETSQQLGQHAVHGCRPRKWVFSDVKEMLERDQESAASMHLAVEGSSLCPSQYTYNLMVMHLLILQVAHAVNGSMDV